LIFSDEDALSTKKYTHFCILLWAGFTLLSISLATAVTIHPDSSPGVLYGPHIIASIGVGLLFPVW
jgi:hypothetical protein